jgi:hypothetical protein
MSALHTPTNEGQALKRVRKIGSAEKRTAGHSFAASAGSALPPEIAEIVPAVARDHGYSETDPVTLDMAWTRWGKQQPMDKVLEAVMYVRTRCVKDNNALAALLEQAWRRLKAQNGRAEMPRPSGGQ